MIVRLISELMWIGGAAGVAWLFPKTFVVIFGISAVITVTLRLVENSFK